MAIVDGAIYSRDYVLAEAKKAAEKPPSDSAIEQSPLREVVYAIRSIMPLIIVLVLLIFLVLRRGLPECSFWVEPPAEEEEDASVRSGVSGKSVSKIEKIPDKFQRASMAIVGTLRTDSMSTAGTGDSRDTSEHGGGGSAAAALAAAAAAEAGEAASPGKEAQSTSASTADLLSAGKAKSAAAPGTADDVPVAEKKRGWFARNVPLLGGVAAAQIGMILFNLGLTYGFTKLGDQTGYTLPAAYLTVSYDPKSPYYSYAGGLILLIVVVFVLGVLATRAEPALNVLGRTVERLSGGAFTAKLLIGSVCIGVGTGMAVGGVKILVSTRQRGQRVWCRRGARGPPPPLEHSRGRRPRQICTNLTTPSPCYQNRSTTCPSSTSFSASTQSPSS